MEPKIFKREQQNWIPPQLPQAASIGKEQTNCSPIKITPTKATETETQKTLTAHSPPFRRVKAGRVEPKKNIRFLLMVNIVEKGSAK